MRPLGSAVTRNHCETSEWALDNPSCVPGILHFRPRSQREKPFDPLGPDRLQNLSKNRADSRELRGTGGDFCSTRNPKEVRTLATKDEQHPQ
jgi:hypothetical protein